MSTGERVVVVWLLNGAAVATPTNQTVVSDQCEYGTTTMDPSRKPLAAEKSTMLATTSKRMRFRLCKKRFRTHTHEYLFLGKAAEATF